FFFQAEDGIRDFHVTGVQTCALPIYTGFTLGTIACAVAPSYFFLLFARSLSGVFGGILGALILAIVSDAVPLERRAQAIGTVMEIGRASCRERVKTSEVGRYGRTRHV